MPDEKTIKTQENVKNLNDLVSISLTDDGNVNLKLTKEQFSEAVREAIDAGDSTEAIPVCLLKYYSRESVELEAPADFAPLPPCSIDNLDIQCSRVSMNLPKCAGLETPYDSMTLDPGIVLCRPKDMLFACEYKLVAVCPTHNIYQCKKLEIPVLHCGLNRVIEWPMLRDWIKQGILLERSLSEAQLKLIMTDRF